MQNLDELMMAEIRKYKDISKELSLSGRIDALADCLVKFTEGACDNNVRKVMIWGLLAAHHIDTIVTTYVAGGHLTKADVVVAGGTPKQQARTMLRKVWDADEQGGIDVPNQ